MIALVLYPFIKTLYNRFFMGVCHIKSKKAAKMLSILVAYLIAVGAFAILIGFVVPQIYKSLLSLKISTPILLLITISLIRRLKMLFLNLLTT